MLLLISWLMIYALQLGGVMYFIALLVYLAEVTIRGKIAQRFLDTLSTINKGEDHD